MKEVLTKYRYSIYFYFLLQFSFQHQMSQVCFNFIYIFFSSYKSTKHSQFKLKIISVMDAIITFRAQTKVNF